MRYLIAAMCGAALACGGPGPSGEDGGLGDGGVHDGGGGDGGGTDGGGSDGGGSDGGPGPLTLALVVAQGPQRGPVLLEAVLNNEAALTPLAFEQDGSGSFALATGAVVERALGKAVFAWRSFEDFALDGAVQVRVRAQGPSGELVATATIALRNAPDVERLVATAHRLVSNGGGGATSDGTEVSLFRWSSQLSSTITSARRVIVGRAPKLIRAAPNGRAFVVVRDDGFALIHTPLDADPDAATVTTGTSLPYGTPTDARFSADGRFLYVIGSRNFANQTSRPTLWRYALGHDWTQQPSPQPLAHLSGPPTYFDEERSSGRLLVACGGGDSGAGDSGTPTVLWLSPDGQELGRLEEVVSYVNALGISPQGGVALATSTLLGNKIIRLRLTPTSVAQEGSTLTTVLSPTDLAFHPSGEAAVVSNLDKNKLTPLSLAAGGLSTQAEVTSVSLAAELDVIERGSAAGTVFVSALTKVMRSQLSSSGSASAAVTVADFGSGTQNITQGMAVQR
jgi:DNA-binding beta-propeller fold protein YncE